MAHRKRITQKYMRLSEVCDHLGLSKPTVTKLISAGTLTPYRPMGVGKMILVAVEDVDRMMKKSAGARAK